jgi:hypothetical protein
MRSRKSGQRPATAQACLLADNNQSRIGGLWLAGRYAVPQVSDSLKPSGKGSVGSSPIWLIP